MTGSQIFSNFKKSTEPIQLKLSYVRYTVYDQEFTRSLRCSYSNEPSVFTKDLGHRVDPASIPGEQFSLKCLPPVEVSCSFLRPASTPEKQLKAFKSLEAFSQMVSGFINSQ